VVPVCQLCRSRFLNPRRVWKIAWLAAALIGGLLALSSGAFFVGACLGAIIGAAIAAAISAAYKEPAWFDKRTGDLLFANAGYQKEFDQINFPLLGDPSVERFFQTTRNAWASGLLSEINPGAQKAGQSAMDEVFRRQMKAEGSSLRMLLGKFRPLDGELLVGLLPWGTGVGNPWFILTNVRLIQRNGRTGEFVEVALADVATFNVGESALSIGMTSGETVSFDQTPIHPIEKALAWAISQAKSFGSSQQPIAPSMAPSTPSAPES
jgi:hypothetical protein